MLKVSEAFNSSKKKFNPMNEINNKIYLNSISLKYRYEQMKLGNIAHNMNLTSKTQSKNLFKRLEHIGHNIDRDISRGRTYLHELQRKRLIEGQFDYDIHPKEKKGTSVDNLNSNPTVIDHKHRRESSMNFQILEKRTNEDNNINNNTKLLSQTQDNLSTKIEPKKEDEIDATTVVKKKIQHARSFRTKSVIHQQKFRLYFKTDSDDKASEMPAKRVYDPQKNLPQTRISIYQTGVLKSKKSSVNASLKMLSKYPNEDEYEKVNYRQSVHLIKKYIMPPKNEVRNDNAEMKGTVKNFSINGKIDLSKLFTSSEDQHRSSPIKLMWQRRSRRENITNDNPNTGNTGYTTGNILSKTANLPSLDINPFPQELNEHNKMKKIREENEETRQSYKKEEELKFLKEVDHSRYKIENIHHQINKMLSTASKKFEIRIDKTMKKNQ